MKVQRFILSAILVISLLALIPISAQAQSASIGVHSVAACTDTATVAIIGMTGFSNNVLEVKLLYINSKGEVKSKGTHTTAPFGSGRISLAIEFPYANETLPAGAQLRVEARLRRLSSSGYVDAGYAQQQATVVDKSCIDTCSVTVDTTDRAPRAGTLTLRSHYGTFFRPEGWLHGAVPVSAGQAARATFVGIPCGWTVRAWYYPQTGDPTPLLLPSQYWPHEFAATQADGTNPYTSSFAAALPATAPLEPNDPFVHR